jgi:hypothetical protein
MKSPTASAFVVPESQNPMFSDDQTAGRIETFRDTVRRPRSDTQHDGQARLMFGSTWSRREDRDPTIQCLMDLVVVAGRRRHCRGSCGGVVRGERHPSARGRCHGKRCDPNGRLAHCLALTQRWCVVALPSRVAVSEQDSQELEGDMASAGSTPRGSGSSSDSWSESEQTTDQGYRETSTSWDEQLLPGWGRVHSGAGGPLRKRRSSSD